MAHPLIYTSLCGGWPLQQRWLPLCVGTFGRFLRGAAWHVLSDGTLADGDFDRLEEWSQCRVVRHRVAEEDARRFLEPYPALRHLRAQTPFAKRLLDILMLFPAETTVCGIDTDVFFRGPLVMPDVPPRFAYCVDEVPGYSGSVGMCLRAPLLRALNGGLLVYRLSDIDLDWLEQATARYLMHARSSFWTEQTAFALIGGRLPDAMCFAPDQCDIVSGLRKRVESTRLANRTTYFSVLSSGPDDPEAVRRRIERAWAIHFAGPGKPWIDHAAALPAKAEPEMLRFVPRPVMGPWERSKLAARVFIRESAIVLKRLAP